MTMKRYPNGVDGEYFYEKNCPEHRPSWVKTAAIWSEGNDGIHELLTRAGSADPGLGGESRRSSKFTRPSRAKDMSHVRR